MLCSWFHRKIMLEQFRTVCDKTIIGLNPEYNKVVLDNYLMHIINISKQDTSLWLFWEIEKKKIIKINFND